MAVPTTMRALKTYKPSTVTVAADVPVPARRPGFLLVKVAAVGLNPTDFQALDLAVLPDGTYAHEGCTPGVDFAGTVVAVGPEAGGPAGTSASSWKVGDRVAGGVHGCNPFDKSNGAFAEYLVAWADHAFHIPDWMGHEEAATLGVAAVTVGQVFAASLNLPLPHPAHLPPVNPGADTAAAAGPYTRAILINAASSGTGQFAVRVARLMGLYVIATCSPANFEVVKSLGADVVLDYSDPDKALADIRAAFDAAPPAVKEAGLRHSLDCIRSDITKRLSLEPLTIAAPDLPASPYVPLKTVAQRAEEVKRGTQHDPEPRYRAVTSSLKYDTTTYVDAALATAGHGGDDQNNSTSAERGLICKTSVLGYTALGTSISLGPIQFDARPDHYDLQVRWSAALSGLFAERKLKGVTYEACPGGLAGITEGIDRVRNAKVRGKKLVYRIDTSA